MRAIVVLPYAASKSQRPLIQVKNVTHFSYGAYQNGDVDIWASGEAGWYRIKPGTAYIDLFQGMIEAVNMLYFTIDCHKSGKVNADELFAKYAQIHHITVAESKENFYSHSRFLASRMVKGEEGINWGHTGFYQHLRKMHPEAFGLQSPRTAPAPALLPSATSRLRKEASVSSLHRPSSRNRTRPSDIGKEKATVAPSRSRDKSKRASLPSEMNKAKAIVLWKFMQKVVNETRPEPTTLTIEIFSHYLMQTFTFEDEEEAAHFLQYLSADLVSMMQQKRRRTYEWPELPIYDELLEAKLSAATKRKMAAVELERRAQPLRDEADEEISSVDSESSEEQVADEEDMHHTKSGLRPKSGSKFSGKGANRGKGKGPQTDGANDDDGSAEPMDIDRPNKRKTPSEEDEHDSPPKKRFTRSQGDEDPELEDLEFAWQQAKSTGIPIRRKSTQYLNGEASATRLMVVSEPIFNTEATDSGDVWTCTHAGCLHKVYGASETTSKDLIKEHLDEHKSNSKIDLILSEETRTHLPVRSANLSHSHLPIHTTRKHKSCRPQHTPPLFKKTLRTPNPAVSPIARQRFFADNAEALATIGDKVYALYSIKPLSNSAFFPSDLASQQPDQANTRDDGIAKRADVGHDDGSKSRGECHNDLPQSDTEESYVIVEEWLHEMVMRTRR